MNHTNGQADDSSERSMPVTVNPATGLPMATPHIDVLGNPLGVDFHGGYPCVNPSTGLPMNGATGIDVGGRLFGQSNVDTFIPYAERIHE